jgi:hypothetical protein
MKFLSFILSTALFFSGCGLFSTRSAEAPDQPRSDFQQAVTPDILIENLVNSLQDKDVENYMATFSDPSFGGRTFTFSPSSSALSQYPSLSEGWGTKNEEQYFNNLIAKVSSSQSITLTLTNVSTSPQGDSLIYTASYTLNVPNSDPNLPQYYAGDLKFNMMIDSRSVWTIYYWQDSKNSDNPTWSDLKGRVY